MAESPAVPVQEDLVARWQGRDVWRSSNKGQQDTFDHDKRQNSATSGYHLPLIF